MIKEVMGEEYEVVMQIGLWFSRIWITDGLVFIYQLSLIHFERLFDAIYTF